MQEKPEDVYQRLLAERRTQVAEMERRHRKMGYLRLGVAGAAAAVVWISLASRDLISIAWVLVPAGGFAALMALHDRLLRRLELRRRAAAWLERGLARLHGKWAGTGERGERYLDPAHSYAQDLDLFGKGSLFELLSTARTRSGEDTLAAWLLAPADAADGAGSPGGRGGTAAAAGSARRPGGAGRRCAYGGGCGVPGRVGEPRGRGPRDGRFAALVWICTITGVMGLAALISLLLESAHMVRPVPGAGEIFLIFLIANGWFLHRYRGVAEQIAGAVEKAAGELKLLSQVLERLERERFQTPLLAELRAGLEADGEPASKRLARLRRLAEMLDSRDHFLVRALEIFVLWTPHLALHVEKWRRRSGPSVRRWLRAVGEMEALSSLASHAFEHPEDVFAEVVEETAPAPPPASQAGQQTPLTPASGAPPPASQAGQQAPLASASGAPSPASQAGQATEKRWPAPLIEAEGMGHPLIGEERVVRNDLRMAPPLAVLIVSGSNMSGKSTLLRTLGTNVVLAQAGATVRARRMRLTPLAVGASIRVSDSLENGISRFYAEILRLRQILEMTAGGTTVLFLIDEFLHGTNSHDRRIGADALVSGLVERGAIGLVTTHDLALAAIVDELGERAANVHFEDSVEDGRMRFDYVMRPGVVRKSNAIELMRSVGLEV